MRAETLIKRKEITNTKTDTTRTSSQAIVRTLIEAGMIPEAARLTAADQEAINSLSTEEASAIVALRVQLGSDPARQNGHAPKITF